MGNLDLAYGLRLLVGYIMQAVYVLMPLVIYAGLPLAAERMGCATPGSTCLQCPSRQLHATVDETTGPDGPIVTFAAMKHVGFSNIADVNYCVEWPLTTRSMQV